MYLFTIFTARQHRIRVACYHAIAIMPSAVLATIDYVYVRLSVCLSHAGIMPK